MVTAPTRQYRRRCLARWGHRAHKEADRCGPGDFGASAAKASRNWLIFRILRGAKTFSPRGGLRNFGCMQVITYMQSTTPRSPSDTHQRLLDAAARVFAQYGLAGATTRAIAEEAGVNEVTLFRHFQSKDRLLAEVVGRNFGPAATAADADTPPPDTSDLKADLMQHALRYERLLKHNLPLVRTMLGEIQHHARDQERQVFHGIFRPAKAAIRDRIDRAQQAGELRRDMRADILADLLGSMIFTGVLRRTGTDNKLDYPASTYLETAVDVIVRGAAPECARHE
ncbi:MAG TPA: TetR/AcrR family transcriptional regulator [Opitutaceae bacterium]|nr:TetR/AcrR family transcriptional regulator [Opitutaceae bacterium]